MINRPLTAEDLKYYLENSETPAQDAPDEVATLEMVSARVAADRVAVAAIDSVIAKLKQRRLVTRERLADATWVALKEAVAATPDKSQVKRVVMVSEAEIKQAVNASLLSADLGFNVVSDEAMLAAFGSEEFGSEFGRKDCGYLDPEQSRLIVDTFKRLIADGSAK